MYDIIFESHQSRPPGSIKGTVKHSEDTRVSTVLLTL